MMAAVHFIDDVAHAPPNATALNTPAEINKSTLLSALASACNFPSYFGHNWDAAWDALSEQPHAHLLLDLRHACTIDERDLNAFIDLIADACELNGQPQLWIVQA